MGLFSRMREPVFLKESSDAEVHLEKLKALEPLLNEDGKNIIRQDMKWLEYGIAGEKNISFELKNSHMPMYVLHDIYIEDCKQVLDPYLKDFLESKRENLRGKVMDGKLRNMTSLYLLNGDKILFLYRIGSRVVNNSYVGSAGGHFEKEELNDAEACVLRELNEETGLVKEDIADLTLRYVTLRLKNNEIRQNYYFFAKLVNTSKEISSNEGRLEWVDCNNVTSLEMPYTSKYVVEHFLKLGRHTACLYSGIATDKGIDFIEMQEF